ncbi:MAG: hypothetical protein IT290_09335 [Deltaproteobacteria bacterium]|nr:hypothetical protein [Deltaproteobacteria bacterium]
MRSRLTRHLQSEPGDAAEMFSIPFIGVVASLLAFFIVFSSRMVVDPQRGQRVLRSTEHALFGEHTRRTPQRAALSADEIRSAESPFTQVLLDEHGQWRITKKPERSRLVAHMDRMFVGNSEEISANIFPVLDTIAELASEDRLSVAISLVPNTTNDALDMRSGLRRDLRRLDTLGNYLVQRGVSAQKLAARTLAGAPGGERSAASALTPNTVIVDLIEEGQ